MVASKDKGMDTKAVNATRRSRVSVTMTRVISTAPSARSPRTPASAVSMKFAGRWSAGNSVTPWASSPGFNSASATSTAFVAVKVLVPNWLVSAISTPGWPMIRASPNFGAGASTTSATADSGTGLAAEGATMMCANSPADIALPRTSTWIRCAAESTKPPPWIAVAARTAVMTSATASPRASSATASTRTSSRETSPPKIVTLATPGTDKSRGFMVQSARSRSAVGVIFGAINPSLRRSMVEEVSGDSTGVPVPMGKRPATSATRSATIWRAR